MLRRTPPVLFHRRQRWHHSEEKQLQSKYESVITGRVLTLSIERRDDRGRRDDEHDELEDFVRHPALHGSRQPRAGRVHQDGRPHAQLPVTGHHGRQTRIAHFSLLRGKQRPKRRPFPQGGQIISFLTRKMENLLNCLSRGFQFVQNKTC